MYYTYNPDLSFRYVAGEAVIVNLKNGEMTVLNPSGAFIWQQLGAGIPAQEISSAMPENTSVSSCEVDSFIATLEKMGLVYLSESRSVLHGSAGIQNGIDIPAELFSTPEILSSEKLETLAGVCGSGYTGEVAADCRTSGLGCWDINT